MPLHDQAARDILTRWLSDLGKALIVAQALSDIARDRFEGGEFGAVMGSGWRDGSILPPEQMLMMMFTHSDNCLGRIVRTKVRAAGLPRADRYRAQNAAALADLPGPFTATVDEREYGAPCDGWLEWSEPVEASVCTNETHPVRTVGPSTSRCSAPSRHGACRWRSAPPCRAGPGFAWSSPAGSLAGPTVTTGCTCGSPRTGWAQTSCGPTSGPRPRRLPCSDRGRE